MKRSMAVGDLMGSPVVEGYFTGFYVCFREQAHQVRCRHGCVIKHVAGDEVPGIPGQPQTARRILHYGARWVDQCCNMVEEYCE